MSNIQDHRELFIRNRDTIQNYFFMTMPMMHLCCAYLYTMRGRTADKDALKQTKKLLEARVGGFSNFHSTARDLLVCMLEMSDKPEELLDRALQLYDLLKRELTTSTYLPIVAMLLAEKAAPGRCDELIARISTLYKRMRSNHPWMTDSGDYTMCALLAMSDQSDDELLERIEQCYTTLKNQLATANNEIQSLAHVMVLTPGDMNAKCERVLAMTDMMKSMGHKWNGWYEMPILGVLAADPHTVQELAAAIADNDEWLKHQKGFGFFSSISRMQRLMYAALLTQEQSTERSLSVIITEQAAILGAMGATNTANSNRHHNY